MTLSTRDQAPIRCVVMRGGSSRALFFLEHDLPSDPAARDRVVLAAFGSPDERQIDGLGGADPLTSKVAVIQRSLRPDADIDYTFGQVSIATPQVHWKGNCGNISSAVGPFAVDEGLVRVTESTTKVRIYNTNTDRIFEAEVPVRGGRAATSGDTAIAGVPGTGAPIALNFAGSEGAVTGSLQPTGSPTDELQTDEGVFTVSIVDAATPFVFVEARSVGVTGLERPEEINGNLELTSRLEAIRSATARRLGLVREGDIAADVSPSVPRVAMVASPVDHQIASSTLRAADISIIVRQMSMQRAHKAFAVTGSVCLGAAVALPGTVPNRVARHDAGTLRIAHPEGVMEVEVEVQSTNSGTGLKRAVVIRTARRLMEGHVFVPVSIV